MYCQQIVNQIYKPNSFKYLELGVGNKIRFNEVNTNKKISVDINGIADYNNGTDNFFEQYVGEKFDIVFIDGLHEINQIIKDTNNSIKHLKSNGVIYLHDLYPPNEEHTNINSCGNGFKLLKYFYDNKFNFKFAKEDFGLTLFIPGSHTSIFNVTDISYSDLKKMTELEEHSLSLKEIQEYHKKYLYDISEKETRNY